MTSQTEKDLSEQIVKLLEHRPGAKAREIAGELHIDKSVVNSFLYGVLKTKVVQDPKYGWHVRGAIAPPSVGKTPSISAKLDTPLAKLASYYLDCLNHDDQGGVSVFAASKFKDLDYVELPRVPFVSDEDLDPFALPDAQKLLNKVRADRGRLTAILGYPVYLRKAVARSGWEGFFVEPVLLFGFDEASTKRSSTPVLLNEPPQINFRAIRSLTGGETSNIIEEVVQLSEELGLVSSSSEAADLDEIVPRLGDIRSEWNWRERPDPENVISQPPLSQVDSEGVYNRAVLMVTERSPYTKGLETELSQLQATPESSYSSTALGSWVNSGKFEASSPSQVPLIEILPLNSEQRQAVLQGLTNPLTVITGPPGTGKSQVVTSLLVNAAWQGKTVLFASKNNKAVDVVETRVNALGPRPVLLRLGSGEYQARLAEYLLSLLSAACSSEDEMQYQESRRLHDEICKRFEAVDKELGEKIQLRNAVDRLEQQVETIRKEVGPSLFRTFRALDISGLQRAILLFQKVVTRAYREKQPPFTRIIWFLIREGRFVDVMNQIRTLQPIAANLGLKLPAQRATDYTIGHWAQFAHALGDRLASAERARKYFALLGKLSAAKPIEEINREHIVLVEGLVELSQSLWESWLRLQPKRLTAADRLLLQEYGTILQLVVSVQTAGGKLEAHVFRQYQRLFPKMMHLLSCWAVTSLSARGRIPFEPGFFDLLVIDEASQCDIASALPLLYRAKRAVIIGDPQQLRHISSLPKKQDAALLAKHGLGEARIGWSYSVTSLFDLAAGMTQSEDIVALRDHHRSHADIIEFSNKYFYEGRLRIATDYQRLRTPAGKGPAVRWVDVKGHATRPPAGGALNEVEAQAVVKELQRLVVEQGYEGSIGVVSPFRAQANRIRDLVSQKGDMEAKLVRNEFLADTVHRFQGDERDLMIFSPVVSAGISDGAIGFLRGNANLFNVAITRARSALVVVADRAAAAASGVEYLSKFSEYVSRVSTGAHHAQGAQKEIGPGYPTVARPELVSDWEKLLYEALYAAGFRPIPQYDIEKYTLDLALLTGVRKLDIEVDGERYHREWDGELCRRDQIRNQRLMELGWDVMRFWVYQVRDELDSCVRRVEGWVNEN